MACVQLISHRYDGCYFLKNIEFFCCPLVLIMSLKKNNTTKLEKKLTGLLVQQLVSCMTSCLSALAKQINKK